MENETDNSSSNSSKMELKDTNPNNEIVLVRDLNLVKLFFWKIVKIEIRNESYKLFFQEGAMIVQKTRLSIIFTSLIQMEQITTKLPI